MDGYCTKCRVKQTMCDPYVVTMRNGKHAVIGTCAECSSRIYRIGEWAVQVYMNENSSRNAEVIT